MEIHKLTRRLLDDPYFVREVNAVVRDDLTDGPDKIRRAVADLRVKQIFAEEEPQTDAETSPDSPSPAAGD